MTPTPEPSIAMRSGDPRYGRLGQNPPLFLPDGTKNPDFHRLFNEGLEEAEADGAAPLQQDESDRSLSAPPALRPE